MSGTQAKNTQKLEAGIAGTHWASLPTSMQSLHRVSPETSMGASKQPDIFLGSSEFLKYQEIKIGGIIITYMSYPQKSRCHLCCILLVLNLNRFQKREYTFQLLVEKRQGSGRACENGNIIGICIRVIQRNRTNRIAISIAITIYKEIYYRELAHIIMEVDKSQDLQWDPRERPQLIVQFQSKCLQA